MPTILDIISCVPAIIWATLWSICEWFIPRTWYAKDVSNDVVLVTGAGSGLGREISLEFARLGSSLVLWDIDQNGLEESQQMVEAEQAKRHKENFCKIYNVDVSKSEFVQKAAQQVEQDLKKIRSAVDGEDKYVSILVNNAGIFYCKEMLSLSDAQIERMFDINILAHFWTVRAFLPQMIKRQRGHIVEIASVGGLFGALKQVTYCSTKFATVGFEESLDRELTYLGLDDKIKTTVICPYFFQSNLFTGINNRIIGVMGPQYVAKETVLAVRCNHYRLILPGLASLAFTLKGFIHRRMAKVVIRCMNIDQALKHVQGKGLDWNE